MKRLALLAFALAGCTPASHGIVVDMIVDEGCAGAKADLIHVQATSRPNHYYSSQDIPAHDFFHNEHELVILVPDSETDLDLDLDAVVAAVTIDHPTFHFSFTGPGRYHEPGGFAAICPPVDGDGGMPADGGMDALPPTDDLLPQLWAPVDSKTAFDLFGVWGASPDELYVVGGQSTSLTGTMGGATWVNDSFANGNLFAVWGDGQGNVWEVGDGGLVYMKTANLGFQQIATCGNGPLFGIAGDGSGDLWIGGAAGSICHALDGKSFVALPALGTGDVNGGWALSGKSYLFAADDGMKVDIVSDGTPTLSAIPAAANEGLEAAASAGTLRYLVGGAGTILTSNDGQAWDRTVLGQGFLHGVWAGGQVAYVVGEGPVIYRTTDGGAHWSQEGFTVPVSGALNAVYSVGGLVIAVGDGGTILIRQ